MKLALTCALCLIGAVIATVAAGYAPTLSHWGEPGRDSLFAVAVICGGAAIIAMLPMAIVAPKRPDYIGQAALAGTVLRLLLTMGALVAYQVLYSPQLASFLFWAPILYLLLLAIETTFGVVAVKRYYRPTSDSNNGATS